MQNLISGIANILAEIITPTPFHLSSSMTAQTQEDKHNKILAEVKRSIARVSEQRTTKYVTASEARRDFKKSQIDAKAFAAAREDCISYVDKCQNKFDKMKNQIRDANIPAKTKKAAIALFHKQERVHKQIQKEFGLAKEIGR